MNFPLAQLKKTVRYAFCRLGYDIHRISESSAGLSLEYQPIRSIATYSPWNIDRPFLEIYQAILSHTLYDIYRCYEIWSLVEQTQKLEGSLIEVGVWRGGTGALIAKRAQLCGITDPVYLCDTFTGVVKASDRDSQYMGGEHSDTSRQTVEALVYKDLGLDQVRILEGIFPDETAHLIEQKKFRFCHVDVDVYQSAKDIGEWIWEKMVVGGIVLYDDYGMETCPGIREYIDEQRGSFDRLIVYNLNGHAVIVKLK